MPRQRQDMKREDTPRPFYHLRSAITELIHWMRVWKAADPAVMVQALWLVNLAGVENSGVHRKVSAKVLRLMRDVAMDEIDPNHALELMKGWEVGRWKG